ncbi:MAG: glycosyltransferase [Planctomycetota bacterium]|nr:glycosyltransferase [Planctomycetota bacterium]
MVRVTPLYLVLPLAVLAALSAGAGVFYGVVLWRIARSARTLPTARDGLSLPPPKEGWPSVCVVIPAHNEEAVISELVRSLVTQDYPRLAIVFALDRCTDGTASVVRSIVGNDPRVEIVEIASCPEGWAGKTHAAWRGVQDARAPSGADMLLFADADTVFDPGLVRAAVALALARGLDLLSLLSELTSEHWFEKLVQPAAGFELIRQYPLDIVNRAERPRAFANGQFMLFRRWLYERIGGHERVKAELLEDIAFARWLDKEKKRITSRWGVLMPGGMLRCRMYRSWDAFARGWKRIYTEAALRRPGQLGEWAWRGRLTGVLLPIAPPVCGLAGAVVRARGDAPLGWVLMGVGAASLTIVIAALSRLYRDQGAPLRWALLYPVGAWIVTRLLAEAASDLRKGVKTRWAGREYVREAR